MYKKRKNVLLKIREEICMSNHGEYGLVDIEMYHIAILRKDRAIPYSLQTMSSNIDGKYHILLSDLNFRASVLAFLSLRLHHNSQNVNNFSYCNTRTVCF